MPVMRCELVLVALRWSAGVNPSDSRKWLISLVFMLSVKTIDAGAGFALFFYQWTRSNRNYNSIHAGARARAAAQLAKPDG